MLLGGFEKVYDEFLSLNLLNTDYIVIIRLRYDFEKEWRNIVELLEYDVNTDSHIWLNDWHEGEQNVEIMSAVPLDYITPDMIGHVIIA